MNSYVSGACDLRRIVGVGKRHEDLCVYLLVVVCVQHEMIVGALNQDWDGTCNDLSLDLSDGIGVFSVELGIKLGSHLSQHGSCLGANF
jgi:hypothetical protein